MNLVDKKLLGVPLLLTLLAGCEMTMLTGGDDEMTSNKGIKEGQVLENPFLKAPDKPNKTEIEIAAYGSPQANPNRSRTEYMPPAPVADLAPMEETSFQYQEPVQQEFVAVMPVPRTSYRPAYTHKALSDYAEQMTMNLLQKTRHITPNSRIAIASFVDFSQDLQTTSVLGNRLSESFMAEMQSYGLSIVDYKAMQSIEVTKDGDLFFDRSGPRGQMQYVLTGTLHRSSRGVEVNARIVNIYDQVIVATTKGFIPHFVVSSLSPEYMLVGQAR